MEIPPEDVDREAGRLQTLNEIGRVVAATLDLGKLYETIYQQVSRVMDTTEFYIALLRGGGEFELAYHREHGQLRESEVIPYGNNVTSLVIDRGVTLLLQSDAEYAAFAAENGLPEVTVGREDSEAKIWVPLNTGNRTIGALSVQSRHRDAYTPDDVQTLAVIASQAAVAIENARLYSHSLDNVRQMSALLRTAQSVNSSLDLPVVLDSILEGMREVIPFHLAAILLPDHRLGVLNVVGSSGPLAQERREQIRIPFGQGITGTVFSGGTPLYVPDVHQWHGYITHGVTEVNAEMAVPLVRGGVVVGVLDAERRERDSFSSDEMGLMTLFASQAAIAIENARLFAEQRKRVVELQTIQSIVQQVTPLHEVRAIAELIDRQLNDLIDYHACRIFTLDPADAVLRPITASGSNITSMVLRVGEGVAGWIAEHGRSVLIPNSLQDERVLQIEGTPRREESIIGAPLIYQGQVRGVITLSRLGTDQFDDNAVRLLEIVAAQGAIAFDRAMLYDALRTDAITDPLTGLFNRRYLIERFREERARAIRNRHSLVTMMLDIDRFKRVNDSHGHDAGDVVLVELARVVRTLVRQEDLVARYGGEEFCILLPEILVEDAVTVAERLRRTVEELTLPPQAGVRHITVSLGLALFRPEDRDHDIFSRADTAMYQVKYRGGNLVCLWCEEGPSFPGLDTGEASNV